MPKYPLPFDSVKEFVTSSSKEKISTFQNQPSQNTNLQAFQCKQCNYSTNKSGNLIRHQESHKDMKNFACDQCDLSFSENRNLIEHIKTAHEGKIIKCEHCNSIAATKSSLARHMKKYCPVLNSRNPDNQKL